MNKKINLAIILGVFYIVLSPSWSIASMLLPTAARTGQLTLTTGTSGTIAVNTLALRIAQTLCMGNDTCNGMFFGLVVKYGQIKDYTYFLVDNLVAPDHGVMSATSPGLFGQWGQIYVETCGVVQCTIITPNPLPSDHCIEPLPDSCLLTSGRINTLAGMHVVGYRHTSNAYWNNGCCSLYGDDQCQIESYCSMVRSDTDPGPTCELAPQFLDNPTANRSHLQGLDYSPSELTQINNGTAYGGSGSDIGSDWQQPYNNYMNNGYIEVAAPDVSSVGSGTDSILPPGVVVSTGDGIIPPITDTNTTTTTISSTSVTVNIDMSGVITAVNNVGTKVNTVDSDLIYQTQISSGISSKIDKTNSLLTDLDNKISTPSVTSIDTGTYASQWQDFHHSFSGIPSSIFSSLIPKSSDTWRPCIDLGFVRSGLWSTAHYSSNTTEFCFDRFSGWNLTMSICRGFFLFIFALMGLQSLWKTVKDVRVPGVMSDGVSVLIAVAIAGGMIAFSLFIFNYIATQLTAVRDLIGTLPSVLVQMFNYVGLTAGFILWLSIASVEWEIILFLNFWGAIKE